jgi:outer membrane protein assembly factor BamD (BamD/ComL family)
MKIGDEYKLPVSVGWECMEACDDDISYTALQDSNGDPIYNLDIAAFATNNFDEAVELLGQITEVYRDSPSYKESQMNNRIEAFLNRLKETELGRPRGEGR